MAKKDRVLTPYLSRTESIAYRHLTKKLTVETLWIYVLSLLSNGPLYGYEFPGRIEERFGFRPNKITCYVVLYRLNQEGLIKEEKKMHSNEGPMRKYYQITDKGMRELENAVAFLRGVAEVIKPSE